jgi:phosphoglycerate kinase
MKFGIKTLDDLTVSGKTVLLRVDINQPVERSTGRLKDTTRIEAAIPTIRELADKKAKVVILAHQGSDIEYANFSTTKPHAAALSEFLGMTVRFIDDVCGPTALEAVRNLSPGEVVLLDNVRYLAEEQTLFELNLKLSHEQQAETYLVRRLAPLADAYVCDAFAAAHRDQPSLCAFQQVLPSAMGRLFEKEYCVVSNLMENPDRPCTFVLGGAKIADAFLMMETILRSGTGDCILAGGLVGQVMLWADDRDIGEPSRALIRKKGFEPLVGQGKTLLAKHRDKIILPVDFGYVAAGKRVECPVGELPENETVVDIGSASARLFAEYIAKSKTVFVNGPVGVFEETQSELGTREIWNALGETQAYTVIGGGDSITATRKFNKVDAISYICTGGGALIRFLSGENLPVVKALRNAAQIA